MLGAAVQTEARKAFKALIQTLVALGDRLAPVEDEERWKQWDRDMQWQDHKRKLREEGWL